MGRDCASERSAVPGVNAKAGRDGITREPSPLTVRQGRHPVRRRMSVAKAAPAPKIATAVMGSAASAHRS